MEAAKRLIAIAYRNFGIDFLEDDDEKNLKLLKKAFSYVASRETQEATSDWDKELRPFRNFTLLAFDIGFFDLKTSAITMSPDPEKTKSSASSTLSKNWISKCPECGKDVDKCTLEVKCIDMAIMCGVTFILERN